MNRRINKFGITWSGKFLGACIESFGEMGDGESNLLERVINKYLLMAKATDSLRRRRVL
jgi:hypothetical protein